MHIDQEKLLDLIADTSGISRENAEKQLKDLVAEINEALEEGEAYEIDGFGIFSQVGNKIIFIPDDNLETEINYKYAGMEPIAMEESGASASEPEVEDDEDTDEDPFEGLLGDDIESEKEEDPEEELKMDSASESEDDKAEPEEETADPDDLIPEEAPGPDKWGIDTYRDEKDENAFSGLLGDSKPLADDEEETEEVAEEKDEPTVISSGEADDMDEDALVEESLLSGDEDFDEDFDDPFAELARTARGKSSDGDDAEDDDTDNEEGSYYSSFDSDDDEDEIDEEDDVFADLDEMEEPDNRSKKEEEVVPVVSAASSDSGNKPEEKKEEKEYVPRSLAKDKKKQGGNSAFIWVAIVILLAVGVTYGLASFNVIYIEGISPVSVPQVSTNTAGPTTDTPPPATEQEAQATQDQTASVEEQPGNEAADEQVTETAPAQTQAMNTATETNTSENSSTGSGNSGASTAEMSAPEMATLAETGQEMYGLMGEAVAEANSGYTIVLYSLSQKDNADDAFDRLSSAGYRTLMMPKENARYGTLWQIGIGQFQTLTDAALAAEDLGDDIPENYMISRIN